MLHSSQILFNISINVCCKSSVSDCIFNAFFCGVFGDFSLKLTQHIPTYINNSFFKKQEQSLYHFYLHVRQGIDKKISWLIKKQVRDSVHKTKPINE